VSERAMDLRQPGWREACEEDIRERTPHRRIIERRMVREYARQVARDLWFDLNRLLNNIRGATDEVRAAELAAQLAYLCTNYDTETRTDDYQGRRRCPASPFPLRNYPSGITDPATRTPSGREDR